MTKRTVNKDSQQNKFFSRTFRQENNINELGDCTLLVKMDPYLSYPSCETETR